jgi:GNAT superfamily N-acetyltransferase
MFNLDNCIVRLAQARDREDLIKVSKKIWDGHDYLPRILDRWLSEPWFFVCEYDARVIACIKLTAFPDNVLWIEGLRVHPKFQGKGIATLLNKHLFRFAEQLRCKNPALSFEFCTYYKNVESLHLTRKLGFRDVEGYYNLEKRGVHRTQKPEFVRDFGPEIFAHFPHYLPLNWHAVHSQSSSLKYIRDHAEIFKTPNGLYLIGSEGEKCITFLGRPCAELSVELPYLQYFYGPRKSISVTLSSKFKDDLPLLLKHNFYFWDDDGEVTRNMLVLRLPHSD